MTIYFSADRPCTPIDPDAFVSTCANPPEQQATDQPTETASTPLTWPRAEYQQAGLLGLAGELAPKMIKGIQAGFALAKGALETPAARNLLGEAAPQITKYLNVQGLAIGGFLASQLLTLEEMKPKADAPAIEKAIYGFEKLARQMQGVTEDDIKAIQDALQATHKPNGPRPADPTKPQPDRDSGEWKPGQPVRGTRIEESMHFSEGDDDVGFEEEAVTEVYDYPLVIPPDQLPTMDLGDPDEVLESAAPAGSMEAGRFDRDEGRDRGVRRERNQQRDGVRERNRESNTGEGEPIREERQQRQGGRRGNVGREGDET